MPIKWTYLICLILIMGICFYLFYPRIENFFIFFPQSAFDFTPEGMQLNHEEVYFHIESAFTSTKDMARAIWLFRLFSYFLPAHYNNQKKITDLDVPKLFIHGERDEIVPFSMGQRLFESAKAPKYFFPLKKAGHNDTFVVGGETYFQTIATFAEEANI